MNAKRLFLATSFVAGGAGLTLWAGLNAQQRKVICYHSYVASIVQ